jgi:hypothetical protein
VSDTSDVGEDAKRTTEQWTYTGIRVNRKGKRACAWLDPDGAELLFIERTADHVIGATYEATVRRQGDGLSLFGQPRFVASRDPGDPRPAVWEVQSRAARVRLMTASRERQAAKKSALDEAIAPLEAIAAKLRTEDEMVTLIAMVSRRLAVARYRVA